MDDAKLATLIPSLEAFAAQKPESYKLRVALLAVLGYAYLLFIVLILLGIVAAILLYARLNYVVLKQAVNFSADDKFLPHEVSEVVLKEIQAQLDKVRGKRSASRSQSS
jgi:cell division septal protein FtsQ